MVVNVPFAVYRDFISFRFHPRLGLSCLRSAHATSSFAFREAFTDEKTPFVQLTVFLECCFEIKRVWMFFFGCAPGFRHHDVIVWNCRNSRLVMSWRSITTISRWVPVVAGSRVTWNSIFYIFEFSFRVFVGNDIQFLSECESRWIWNVCAGFEQSLLWLHIFSNALVAKRINLHPC